MKDNKIKHKILFEKFLVTLNEYTGAAEPKFCGSFDRDYSSIELSRQKLEALYTIDLTNESDARIPAFTNLLKTAIAAIGVDAQTNVADSKIAEKMSLDLYKNRNRLAVIMGKKEIPIPSGI